VCVDGIAMLIAALLSHLAPEYEEVSQLSGALLLRAANVRMCRARRRHQLKLTYPSIGMNFQMQRAL
jgi:hypothetical protein